MPAKKKKKIHPRVAAKRYASVSQYLNWVMNSCSLFGKNQRAAANQNKALVCEVLTNVLQEACIINPQIEKYFDIDSCLPVRKSLLTKLEEGEYHFRLFLRQPGIKNSLQMVIGHYNDVPKGNALLRINNELNTDDKNAIMRWLSPCMEGRYISPEKIVNWTCPAIIKAFKMVNSTEVNGYHVRTIIMQSTPEGLSVIVASKSVDSAHSKTVNTKIYMDIGMEVNTMPKNFALHTLPRICRESVHKIQLKMEDIKTCLYVPMVQKDPFPKWYTDGTLMRMGHRNRTRKALTITELASNAWSRQSTMAIISPAVITGKKPVEKIFWKFDFDLLEKNLVTRIRQQPAFLVIKDAFNVYNSLVNYGNKVLPPVNERTQQALSLWLYKDFVKKQRPEFNDVFLTLLGFVDGCLGCNYCPSFSQPNVNTMTPQNTDPEEDSNDKEPEPELETNEAKVQETENAKAEFRPVTGSGKTNSISKLMDIIKQDRVIAAVEHVLIY